MVHADYRFPTDNIFQSGAGFTVVVAEVPWTSLTLVSIA